MKKKNMVRKIKLDDFEYQIKNKQKVIGLITEDSKDITLSLNPKIKRLIKKEDKEIHAEEITPEEISKEMMKKAIVGGFINDVNKPISLNQKIRYLLVIFKKKIYAIKFPYPKREYYLDMKW